MSVAVNMKGRKASDMRASIIAHQIRMNKKNAKKVKKDTKSKIDPNLSHMNKNYFHDPNRFEFMKEKIEDISKKRQDSGGKKIYKSANVFMIGTLQIGDDSLEALGWKFDKDGKKLPADKQSDRALKNVEVVYESMIKSVKSQPEIYGDVFSATLHMDEGSPHVDFLSDPLDVDEPDRLARYYLNGPKGTPRGHKLSVMQDNIMKNSKIPKNQIDKFGLVRGDGTSKRLNTARELRAEDKRLKEKEESLNKKIEEINENIKGAKSALVSERDSLQEDKAFIAKREKESVVRERRASEKLSKAIEFHEINERLKETYENISDKIKQGIIKPEDVVNAENKTKEAYNPFEDDNPEHLQSLDDALKELSEDDDLQL